MTRYNQTAQKVKPRNSHRTYRAIGGNVPKSPCLRRDANSFTLDTTNVRDRERMSICGNYLQFMVSGGGAPNIFIRFNDPLAPPQRMGTVGTKFIGDFKCIYITNDAAAFTHIFHFGYSNDPIPSSGSF